MGRGASGDFASSERKAAASFARMVRAEGVERVIYLGGLGDRPESKHLRSRHETALALAEHGPPLTYFRAGMVVGAQSESYRTLRYLVQRLPAMIGPAWLKNATQPIAIDDTLRYLMQAPSVAASRGREIQIGGPDVLAYGEMLDRMAAVLGLRRRPRIPVPLITPRLSSLWIGLVTPVDVGVVQAARGGTRRTDCGDRPVGGGAVRRSADRLRRGAAARGRRGSRVEPSSTLTEAHARGPLDLAHAAEPGSTARSSGAGASGSSASATSRSSISSRSAM